jgi:hypothetical protein
MIHKDFLHLPLTKTTYKARSVFVEFGDALFRDWSQASLSVEE